MTNEQKKENKAAAKGILGIMATGYVIGSCVEILVKTVKMAITGKK